MVQPMYLVVELWQVHDADVGAVPAGTTTFQVQY